MVHSVEKVHEKLEPIAKIFKELRANLPDPLNKELPKQPPLLFLVSTLDCGALQPLCFFVSSLDCGALPPLLFLVSTLDCGALPPLLFFRAGSFRSYPSGFFFASKNKSGGKAPQSKGKTKTAAVKRRSPKEKLKQRR